MGTADGAERLHRLTLAVRWGDMDALGHACMGGVDRRSGRSTPLPAALREALPGGG